MPASGPRLLALWDRLSSLPGGRTLFSWILGRIVPYSGSIRPRVLALEPGFVRIALRDRRGVRNHLRSVHAIALANVTELASGLAMTTALPPGVRGIVVRLHVEYVKKARGTLIAESRCAPPDVPADVERDFVSEVHDATGDLVARTTVTWRLGPAPSA